MHLNTYFSIHNRILKPLLDWTFSTVNHLINLTGLLTISTIRQKEQCIQKVDRVLPKLKFFGMRPNGCPAMRFREAIVCAEDIQGALQRAGGRVDGRPLARRRSRLPAEARRLLSTIAIFRYEYLRSEDKIKFTYCSRANLVASSQGFGRRCRRVSGSKGTLSSFVSLVFKIFGDHSEVKLDMKISGSFGY